MPLLNTATGIVPPSNPQNLHVCVYAFTLLTLLKRLWIGDVAACAYLRHVLHRDGATTCSGRNML